MLPLTLTGLKLKNPFMLAAGIMGTTGGSLKRVAESGAGAVVTKSIGAEPSGSQQPDYGRGGLRLPECHGSSQSFIQEFPG